MDGCTDWMDGRMAGQPARRQRLANLLGLKLGRQARHWHEVRDECIESKSTQCSITLHLQYSDGHSLRKLFNWNHKVKTFWFFLFNRKLTGWNLSLKPSVTCWFHVYIQKEVKSLWFHTYVYIYLYICIYSIYAIWQICVTYIYNKSTNICRSPSWVTSLTPKLDGQPANYMCI